MTAWRGPLDAHLAQLLPLLRRRTPVTFDGSPKALRVKAEIQAWNRQAKTLLAAAPHGARRLAAYRQLGNMSFTSLEAVRDQLRRRQQFLQDVLRSADTPARPQGGGTDRRPTPVFRYAFCLTFAGEDRDFAAAVNAALRQKRQKTFFDQNTDARTRLLAEHGPDVLDAVFSEESELCLMFTSKAYKEKMWPTVERLSAQARNVRQGGGYIIPIRLDATSIPGLPHTIGHLSKEDGVARIVREVIAKLTAVRAARRAVPTAAGQAGAAAPPVTRKKPGRATAPARIQAGHAVLIGERVYVAQEVKRASGLTVALRVRSQDELATLRTLKPHGWQNVAFADATGGADVTVERYEERTDHTGRTTVQLQMNPSRQGGVIYGLPAAEAEHVIRQVLTGVPHHSGWVSIPQELEGGVVALAARLATGTQAVAVYARLLGMYYLQKLRLVTVLQEFTVSAVGRGYRVRLRGELTEGPLSGGAMVSIRLDERVVLAPGARSDR